MIIKSLCYRSELNSKIDLYFPYYIVFLDQKCVGSGFILFNTHFLFFINVNRNERKNLYNYYKKDY
jgi:hypothetical protein